MKKEFKTGDMIYHKDFGLNGKFIGYAQKSDDKADVEFVIDEKIEKRQVLIDQLIKAENKQKLVDDGYKYICAQNSQSRMELWAKFNGYADIIIYLYYVPETDLILEQTKQTISYTHLDMMGQMRDKMREDFEKLDIEYDKRDVWM